MFELGGGGIDQRHRLPIVDQLIDFLRYATDPECISEPERQAPVQNETATDLLAQLDPVPRLPFTSRTTTEQSPESEYNEEQLEK